MCTKYNVVTLLMIVNECCISESVILNVLLIIVVYDL